MTFDLSYIFNFNSLFSSKVVASSIMPCFKMTHPHSLLKSESAAQNSWARMSSRVTKLPTLILFHWIDISGSCVRALPHVSTEAEKHRSFIFVQKDYTGTIASEL